MARYDGIFDYLNLKGHIFEQFHKFEILYIYIIHIYYLRGGYYDN